ncbi:MAG: beta-N-acetylhexosaminidase [Muribaculaceae bacterium]|nr:beta-N-acetylhexosaminidase [Muribaculaceae bacterium]
MNRLFVFAAVLSSVIGGAELKASVNHLLPPVKTIAYKDCAQFSLKRAIKIDDLTDTELLRQVLTEAGATIDNGAEATVRVKLVNSIEGAFNHNLADYPDEAYSIDVAENVLEISATTPMGVIRASQTLAQLAIDCDAIDSVWLTDWPAFKLRGYMHDVGRSFITAEELKKQIRLLSAFKVNTFHWHLTENQAWRFEVKAYPELTSAESMTRFAGNYYTQQECREVMAEARKYGVTVIPEIDMPGHSEAFERAMGCAMQSDRGKQILLTVLEEVVDVFADSPYIHIGADEKTITDNTFLDTMIDKLHGLGKKVVCWNPIRGVAIANHNFDMTQMWSTAGSKVAGVPNIDCRYNYINHFDVFADVVGIYKSSIYYQQTGTDEVAGTITAVWNDRKTPGQEDIINQNNFYASVLASAERAWVGGGKQYIEQGGTMLPVSGEEFEEFADWERRFLLHKDGVLKDEPIPYVKQTNVRWLVTEMFDNGGNASASFAPENGTDNVSWEVTPVCGAGIYLRHTWGGTVPGLYGNAPINRTAYAYTSVYSPVDQVVGAQIEFQNYGRSEKDAAPDQGKWDRKGSRIWLNGEELLPDAWDNSGKGINNEVDLLNENFTARRPLKVTLRQGWNKVMIKLPYVNAPGVRLNKWMWTFVLTDTEGRNAVDGLIYSPSECMDEESETLASMILTARSRVNSLIREGEVGYYPSSAYDVALLQACDEYELTLSEQIASERRREQMTELQRLLDEFNAHYSDNGVVQPAENVYYYMSTPLRDNRYATADAGKLHGQTAASEAAAWVFDKRSDGTYDIKNFSTDEFVATTAAHNTQITLSNSAPAAGWSVKAADEAGYVIITSGSAQFNQTNSSLGYKVYNWGSGTNIADTGCKYVFTRTSLSKPQGGVDSVVVADSSDNGRIYDLQGRRINEPARGINIVNGNKVLVQ